MNWLQLLFGKKVNVVPPVSSYNRPMVERIVNNDDEDEILRRRRNNDYDPLDMLNPMNPLSPISPFWIGDENSVGDVHELIDQTPQFSGFGGGETGGGGAGSEFDTNDGTDTPTYPQSDDYSSSNDNFGSSSDDYSSSSDSSSYDSGSSDSGSSSFD